MEPFPLHKKLKISVKDFFSKCDQIRRKLLIWSHLPKKSLTLLRMGFFAEVGGKHKCSLSKICHWFLTIMKLGTVIPKEVLKNISHVTHPLGSANISSFSPKISIFCYFVMPGKTDKNCILVHNF